MGEWSRLNDQAIREASSEIGSSSCNDIKYLISSPRTQTWRQIFTFSTKTRCDIHPAEPVPVVQSQLFTRNSINTPHYTVSIENEQQTETLHRSWDISTSFNVQIRLKIELCTSTALQSAPAFWADSLLVFLLWLNAFGCFPASIQPPHLSHEGTKASGSESRCWSCYEPCKRDRFYSLQVQMH